jgi:hypothetical protein
MSDGSTPATPARASGDTPGEALGRFTVPGAPEPSFEERLWPSFGVWVVVTCMALMIGLVALRFGVTGSLITFVVALAIEVALMVSSTPRLQVGAQEFVAGGARIPLSLLGGAQVLVGEQMRKAVGPELDARAFLCIRGWIKQGVRVQLIDPEDPTPYWVVSSRRPADLVAALEAARDGN